VAQLFSLSIIRTTMTSGITDLSRLTRRRLLADWLVVGFAVLAFAWIPAAMILISKDPALRPVIHTLWLLLPLSFLPLCGFVACWLWRWSLIRKIREMRLHHDA
jgi:hypothetical protein